MFIEKASRKRKLTLGETIINTHSNEYFSNTVKHISLDER